MKNLASKRDERSAGKEKGGEKSTEGMKARKG
jgi:hypothetical protein